MLSTILPTVVLLSVLILIHEFGHFFAAKAVGIYAPRFSLGLGPRVAGFRVGETEFVLSAIPLGGYVKMAGMEGDEAAGTLEGGEPEEEVDPSRTFDAKPIWARTLVISAGVIMNMLFAFLIFTFLSLWFGESIDPSTRLIPPTGPAAAGAAAPLAAVPYGARIVSVGGRPVSSSNEVLEILGDAPAGPSVLAFDGAPPVSLDLPSDPEARLTLLDAVRFVHPAVIGKLASGYPAAAAGVRVGDRIVGVEGRPVRSWDDAVAAIEASPGKPVRIDLERGGSRLSLRITPRADAGSVDGKPVRVGRIGITPDIPLGHRSVGAGEALANGWRITWSTAGGIFGVLKKLVSGEVSPRNVGGLLTIADASGESARMGLEYFLGMMGLISVNLAVLNILPIPVLDGGHLLFLAIEAIRGRPLSVEARIRFSHVGLLIVVALMIWANGNDILRKLGI